MENFEGLLKEPLCKIFDEVVTFGKGFVSVNMIREELENRKVPKADTEMALTLMGCIAAVNHRFFSGVPVLFRFSSKRSSQGFLAEFNPFTRRQREGYSVYAEDLAQLIKERTAYERVMALDERGCLLYDYEMAPRPSLEEVLMGIGLHEVRHRLFHHNQVSRITLGYAKEKGDLELETAIRLNRSVVKSKKELYRNEGRSTYFIRRRSGWDELGAMVVEDLAILKMRQGESFAAVCNVACLHPVD